MIYPQFSVWLFCIDLADEISEGHRVLMAANAFVFTFQLLLSTQFTFMCLIYNHVEDLVDIKIVCGTGEVMLLGIDIQI